MGAVVVEDAERGPCETAVGAAFGDDVVFGLVGGAAAAFGDGEDGAGAGGEDGGDADGGEAFGSGGEDV